MKYLITFLILTAPNYALADWHHGKLGIIAFGYDGKTISIGQQGSTKTDCTCYPAWPNRYCLDNSRDTFDKEYAFLLSVKARDKSVSINIDEKTCKIVAMYEG
ncbi:MAG TPA: hypothetical protein ENH88_13060 [Pseudoalteromonas prydzensis]|uniref:Uncharacterized protein n=1 Tax=Pseudoalteromonas prydzensis TaxID=182141 RepID=A0A7V1CZZ7_9GAMM|nr:hypothetical protein [Pseudoalteromonas prydzensis]HEA17350.1 hypothetical protein [Pseudoalteromonas prydzensis]